MKNVFVKVWLPASILALWQGSAHAGWTDPLFLPSPGKIVTTAAQLAADGSLFAHLSATLWRLFAGFVPGAAAGLLCAALAAVSPLFSRSIQPMIAALYSIPKLTLLPLFILALGTGNRSRIAVVAAGTFLLVATQAFDAVRSVPQGMVEMASNFGARGWTLIRTVHGPASMPRVFAALRVAVGRATVLTVSTEILGAQDGLGNLIWFGWQMLATERIFVGVVMSALLGATLIALFRRLERTLVPWIPALLAAVLVGTS